MRITIKEHLSPFSHVPGTSCLVPKTVLGVQIFPTRIILNDLSGPYPVLLKTFDLALSGPVKNFTVQLDLERQRVVVWGHYQEGFVRYLIFGGEGVKEAFFRVEKCPAQGVRLGSKDIQCGEALDLFSEDIVQAKLQKMACEERLFFGVSKAQDWCLINRRSELSEIFPFWHRLGLLVPATEVLQPVGTVDLLEQCRAQVEKVNKLEVLANFQKLYLAGFNGVLVPRLVDDQYQGLCPATLPEDFNGSPLALLSQGSQLIRGLFFQCSGNKMSILPVLPPAFHCGRYVNIACKHGVFDLEWSKKTLRRMVFRSSVTDEVTFLFQRKLKSYRLRSSIKDKGERHQTVEPISVHSGKTYFFDNFR